MPVTIIGGMENMIFILPGSRRHGRRLSAVNLVFLFTVFERLRIGAEVGMDTWTETQNQLAKIRGKK